MESLQNFVPYNIMNSNMWMKFSLARDGASLLSLLQESRGSQNTILAVETMDGEVFGSYTSTAWKKTHGYFGSGNSFLWRMRKARSTLCHSVIEQAKIESEIDVFPWTGMNEMVQSCTNRQIALGGGALESKEVIDGAQPRQDIGGFGLTLDADLLRGTSRPCATFANECLSKKGRNGFEVANVEVWAFTPCFSVEEAEKMEMTRLFLNI
mmetsp:Transcript_24825/g.36423  ORF Transcript_24825/g.36423 Transcript_24825/m.36423 type:complete len:210 (-) Transcript_24825:217-846(-)